MYAYCPDSLCTSDGRFILSFSDRNQTFRNVLERTVFVFDTKTKKMLRNTIEIGIRTRSQMVFALGIIMKTDTQLVAFGFVNQSWKKFPNLQKLPHYLIEVIAKWFTMDCLYTIIYDGGALNLYKVDIDGVLSPES